ncbi:flagellar biosynthesis regulator FlaF [Salinarimonas soli]|uniref:Flagellar biosynthesis regulator FlaF n=1 Tax=Salinarimonas soli TaxID=1638099 RepID=A0A5B2W119_9HYPH|nr:flagellar biosynthesis regulator FlaF [Salinarimonas soli]KAA2244176.1 flagellar biosynthesis regulator FlaF [Salinarimonas soli]
MQQAAQAYGKVAQQTLGPRELEAHVLLKAATRLQRVRDAWDERQGELDEALTYNRKLWTVLATAATAETNPLPREIKQNIGNLGIFIFKRTVEVMMQPSPEKLDALVNINREVAAGLRAMPAAPPTGA